MKSEVIVEYGEPLQELESEVPTPQGSEVLLKVTHCGVCHSDVHIHDGHFDMGGGNKLDVRAGRQLPFTLGHEIEGDVVAVGPDVKDVKVGDKRVAFRWEERRVGKRVTGTVDLGGRRIIKKKQQSRIKEKRG